MEHPEITSLYKYRPINSYTLDIIANNRIYFPLPASFNDPFDTQCYFRKTSIVTQDIEASNLGKFFPDENTDDMIISTKKDVSVDIDSFKKSLSEFGILSLAESQKNILMWSHYAEDHKGLCIEFERNGENALGDKDRTRKVNYTKNYPSLNPKSLVTEKERKNSMMRVLYTKSKSWSYENEWRMFIPKGGVVSDIPGRIKSITFGERASTMDIDIVRKLTTGSKVALLKANLKESEFGIKLEKIT